jgi:DNA-directed RNA polymerase specialized sigma24 family protein
MLAKAWNLEFGDQSLADLFATAETERILYAAIHGLRRRLPKAAMIFDLRMNGWTSIEIAYQLGKSVRSVQADFARANAWLKRFISARGTGKTTE